MKNLILTLILICTLISNTHAQNFSTEFGKVGKDDLELKTYAKDKEAEAVILFDIGDSFFNETSSGFEIIFKHSKRIKILSEAGMKYAEVEIPFYQEGDIFEKVYDLEAYTYNLEDGRLTRTVVEKENIHDEKVNDFWKVKKLAFPNIKEGSIIEYRYKLSTQYLFNLRDWSFQSKIPTVFSKYTARIVPFYDYAFILQGASSFDSQNSYEDGGSAKRYGTIEYKDYIHEYEMKDIPAFENESYITSINDYIIKLDFQLAKIKYPGGGERKIISTWPDMIKELNDHPDFGKYVNKSERLAAKILDVKALESKSKKERFEAVIEFVKSNYKWNDYNAKYASKSPANLEKDKFGNAADLNLFTIGLLKAIGIEAYPVLISTRKNGKIRTDYPFFQYFNYVLLYAELDNLNVLSDVTDIHCSSYRIPQRCINDQGLLIKENENKDVSWIGLQCAYPTQTNTVIKMHLENSELKSSVQISVNEYQAIGLKEEIGNDTEKLLEHLKKKSYSVEKENVSIADMDENSRYYKYEFQPETTAEIINEKIYISPFLNEPMKDNPLNQETRTYPVDMIYPWRDTYFTSIEIPEGYRVEFVPESFKAKNDLVEMEYTINQTENKLVITFSSFFKKAVYPAEVYSKIKYYMNQMVKKGNEKIVLVKS
ncbi:DUF3857 domain-containing protein [Maribellus sp. CM-23]|uniref:DUF3857 domain-containing protein n=1 Tax=Maribellus sp. CM-23 TaxID=2781026 RepID=UPI001F292D1E|nr:DUF3857 domain-containing protein [Maribellus sp. CM-23]MCE4565783.1 DUF3857 domain-containing protein [Maribellus sp. CM-23]